MANNIRSFEKSEFKLEVAKVYREVRRLDTRIFNSLWDCLRFNHLTPAMNSLNQLVLVKDKDRSCRNTTLEEIVNMCIRWNFLAQSKAAGFELMSIEESAEEFAIIKEALASNRNSNTKKVFYDFSEPTFEKEENFEKSSVISMICIPALQRKESDLIDDIDIMC